MEFGNIMPEKMEKYSPLTFLTLMEAKYVSPASMLLLTAFMML